jgi:hypothetical protein
VTIGLSITILLHVITYKARGIEYKKTGIKIFSAVSHMGNIYTIIEKPRI